MLKLLEGQDLGIDANYKLPPNLNELENKIKTAKKKILDLKENFDGENSSTYKKSTINRAISFLKKLAYSLWKINQTIIEIPKIQPGPSGSIDICWKTPTFQLLINFPEEENEPASYYGDDYGSNTTEGQFDGSKMDQVFLFWLMG